MYDSNPRIETPAADDGELPQRSRGRVAITFRRQHGTTRLSHLHQEGCMKARLPRPPVRQPPEAILINTAGGLCDGDKLATEITAETGAATVITTQACERVYRAAGDDAARIDNRLTLEAGAELHWLPQETIMFDRGRLARVLSVDMAPDATLIAIEATILGRTAMGETVETGYLHDRWRVRRGGRLVLADDVRLQGAIAEIAGRPAVLDGGCAFATLLMASPAAKHRLEDVRAVVSDGIADGVRAGVSAFDDMMVARLVAPDGRALRRALIPILAAARAPRPLPTVWTT